MRIGIWLPIWPLSEWKYEGLTRLLGFMLSGVDPDRDDEYIIYVPYWLADNDIEEFLRKFTPEQRRVISVRKFGKWNIPLYFTMKILEKEKDEKKRRRWIDYRKQTRRSGRQKALHRLLTSALSSLRLSIGGIILLLLLLLSGVVVALLVLVALPFVLAFQAARWVYGRLRPQKAPQGAHAQFWKDLLRRFVPSARLADGLIAVFRELTETELQRLAQLAGRREQVDCWYVPAMNYTSGRFLKSPRIFLFADFVFHDAPTGFPPELVASVRRNFRKVLASADHVICISEHVKKRHVMGVFGYPEDRITVVKHGYVDISHLLSFLKKGEAEALPFVEKTEESRRQAARIIQKGLVEIFNRNRHNFGPIYKNHVYPFLRKMDFSRERYILVSTQNRPYKNTLGVIKAVELYNRKARRPLRLIMTGDAGIDDPASPIGAYIRNKGLYYDVLSIPRVPDSVHAAMYHGATLAIAATFFEGGSGSFVFDEAVSVGTPVLLSRNLAHDEAFASYEEYKTFSFNPYDICELSDTIRKVMSDGIVKLYKDQWKIARERREKRPWSVVQKEYLEVFEKVSGQYRERSGP